MASQDDLRSTRDSAGLSRRQLAEIVGVTPGAIENIEKGRHKPSVELAQRVEAALDAGVLFERGVCACGCGAEITGSGYAHNHAAKDSLERRRGDRRRKMLALLAEGHGREELPRLLGISRSLAYQELAELRRLGLVEHRQKTKRSRPERPAETVSAAHAAVMLQLHPKRVTAMCRAGELPAQRFGQEWAIEAGMVVAAALDRGIELWSIREASRQTGVPRYALVNLEGSGRVRTYPGPRRGRMFRPSELEHLLDQLRVDPDLCECGHFLEPGRLRHADCPASAQLRSAASKEWWAALQGEERSTFVQRRAETREYPERAPSTAEVKCFVCGEEFAKLSRAVTKTEYEGRRNVCPTCRHIWAAGLMRARHAVWHAKTNIDALRAAYAIGEETQKKLRALRTPKFGRRPRNIARSITIEVLHVDRHLSDTQIRQLWRREFGDVNESYVTRLRQESKIRRRSLA